MTSRGRAVSMGTSPDNCRKPVSGQLELWVWTNGASLPNFEL